jgi:regulator of replication initiation timing
VEKLEILEEKISELLKKVSSLKRENEKLCSEIKYIGTENSTAKKVLQEHKSLSSEKVLIRKKIDGIMSKFEKLKI